MRDAIDRTDAWNYLSLICPDLSLKRRGKDRWDRLGQILSTICPVYFSLLSSRFINCKDRWTDRSESMRIKKRYISTDLRHLSTENAIYADRFGNICPSVPNLFSSPNPPTKGDPR